MQEYNWNPWHGCTKLSPGCLNCYVYRQDEMINKDSKIVSKNKDFDLPIRKTRKKEYKIPENSLIYTCFTSDFFLDKADDFRLDAWNMIKERKDCYFLIITKRIDRFNVNLMEDFENNNENIIICTTVENQAMADYRLPIFLKLPIKHKIIICEPLLEKIDLSKYLNSSIEGVFVGGESGNNARICSYSWVLDIKRQCDLKNISFKFHQTGAYFEKNGKVYRIIRKYQHSQARKANIDTWNNKW